MLKDKMELEAYKNNEPNVQEIFKIRWSFKGTGRHISYHQYKKDDWQKCGSYTGVTVMPTWNRLNDRIIRGLTEKEYGTERLKGKV